MSTVSRRSCYCGLRAHIVNQGAVWHPDIWNTKIIIIIIIQYLFTSLTKYTSQIDLRSGCSLVDRSVSRTVNLCPIQLIEFCCSRLSRSLSSASVYDDLDVLEDDIHSDSHFTKAGCVKSSVPCDEYLCTPSHSAWSNRHLWSTESNLSINIVYWL